MDSHPSPQDSDSVVMNGNEKKGPWSPEEDERLRLAVGSSQPRPKWAEIANQVDGRSAKQCRERWEQNLSPRLNKAPISSEEGAYILDFVDRHGKKWAEIARNLVDRSDNNIKNWYNGMAQKGKTGRGPQEEPMRTHFTVEHQQWLAERVRKPSPSLDHRHPHGFHPYGHHRPTPAYAAQHGHSYDALPYAHSLVVPVGVSPAYYSTQPIAPHQPTIEPRPFSSSPSRYSAQLPVPPHPEPPRIQLPPLRSTFSAPVQHVQEQRPSSTDYFPQPDWHSRSLTLQTANNYDMSDYTRTVARSSVESELNPGLSGSVTSTPQGGSPMTPSGDRDVLRHRKSSAELHYERESTGKKMSIGALCN